MPDFDRALAVKKVAKARLLSIPGVHSVGIGPKLVGGKETGETAIVVFLVKKKPVAELPADQVIPTEIDGIKTDVIQEDLPKLHADTARYPILDGGIQIQAGTTLTGLGTLGCIATRSSDLFAITCQHVVAFWPPKPISLAKWVSDDGRTFILWGNPIADLLITVNLTLLPTGVGTIQNFSARYTITAADTLASIGSNITNAINLATGANATAAASMTDVGAQVVITPAAGFNIKTDCVFSAMQATISGNTITLAGSNVPESIAVIDLTVTQTGAATGQDLAIVYTVSTGDTLGTIAASIAANINTPANPGVTANQVGGQITVNSGAGYNATITGANIYRPRTDDPDSGLQALVENAGSGSFVTFQGRVSDDNYALYTAVNLGGQLASAGGFLPLSNGADPSSVANSFVTSIQTLNLPGVIVTPSGPKITVAFVEELDVAVASDVRVGQPDNSFCSACSACCDHRIGRVVDARLQIDAALIQLDPKLKYKAEIEQIGIVTGTHAVTAAELPYKVQKRGRTTFLTHGQIVYPSVDGDIGDETFHRHYTDAFKISPDVTRNLLFSDGGDSGSAVVDDLGRPGVNEVVGILFGGSPQFTLATPIQPILDLFQVQVATATALGTVLEVPDAAAAAGSPIAGEAAEAISAQSSIIQDARPSRSAGLYWERLRRAESEITTTPLGREYATVIRCHSAEVQRLINTNRRVATVWHRSGGPQLVAALLQTMLSADRPLPGEIAGKPLPDCLEDIQGILFRYGSAALRSDLTRYAPRFAQLAGLSYTQLLAGFQAPSAD